MTAFQKRHLPTGFGPAPSSPRVEISTLAFPHVSIAVRAAYWRADFVHVESLLLTVFGSRAVAKLRIDAELLAD